MLPVSYSTPQQRCLYCITDLLSMLCFCPCVLVCLCLSVCLSAGRITPEVVDDFDEFFGRVRRATSNKRLNFGGDPNHDTDTGFL